MILIDTDHATFLKYPESECGRRFINGLAALPPSEIVGVAIVTVEERMRGWLAVIAKEKQAIRQVVGLPPAGADIPGRCTRHPFRLGG